MIRFVALTVVALIANAIALVVTALLLDDMALDAGGFVLAVALFTVIEVLVEPFFRQQAILKAPALLGSTALVATLVSLVVTSLISDGLRISGALTWVLATILVWAISLAGELLLPLVMFKRVLAEARARRNIGRV